MSFVPTDRYGFAEIAMRSTTKLNLNAEKGRFVSAAIQMQPVWICFCFASLMVSGLAPSLDGARDAMKLWASSNAVEDPNNALAAWRDPSVQDVCDFEGIECDAERYNWKIASINLNGFGLRGSIPTWMWNVPRFSLDLSNNQWDQTHIFYDGTLYSSYWTLQRLRCSNCGFYHKTEENATVLPDEWRWFKEMNTFDFSFNPNLIGVLPTSWRSWIIIEFVFVCGSGFCVTNPFPIYTTMRGCVQIKRDCDDLSLPSDSETSFTFEPVEPPSLDTSIPAPLEDPLFDVLEVYHLYVEEDDFVSAPSSDLSSLETSIWLESCIPAHSCTDLTSQESCVSEDDTGIPFEVAETELEWEDTDQEGTESSPSPEDNNSFFPSDKTFPEVYIEELEETDTDDEDLRAAEKESGGSEVAEKDLAMTSLMLPSKFDRDELEEDLFESCHFIRFIKKEPAPKISTVRTIEISLRILTPLYSHLCQIYHCKAVSDASFNETAIFDPILSRMVWLITWKDDGNHSLILTVQDPMLPECLWRERFEFRIDTEPPICEMESILVLQNDKHLITVNCSEPIVLTENHSILITSNAKLESLQAFGDRISIQIEQTDLRHSKIHVELLWNGYKDFVGHFGEHNVSVTVPVTSVLSVGGLANYLHDPSVQAIVIGTMVASGSISSLEMMSKSENRSRMKSNIIRTGLHLQLLCFSAHLAVPKLSHRYIEIVEEFSWTTFVIKGNGIPSPITKIGATNKSSIVENANTFSEDFRMDAFLKTLKGYSIFVSICILLRVVLELGLWALGKGESRSPSLVFPRLDIQAMSVTLPPMMFASARLMTIQTPTAIEMGLLMVIVLIGPFLNFYICRLTIRNLILLPEIHFEKEEDASTTKSLSSFSSSSTTIAAIRNEERISAAEQNDKETDVDPFSMKASHKADLEKQEPKSHSFSESFEAKAQETESLSRWQLKERHPQLKFVKKYGFMFEDVIGEDPGNDHQRNKPSILMNQSFYYLHKVLSAAFLGSGVGDRNPLQIFMVVLLQFCAVVYICIIRPYAEWPLFIVETSVHGFELLIFLCASILVFDIAVDFMNSMIIFSFLMATLILTLFELRRFSLFCSYCKRQK